MGCSISTWFPSLFRFVSILWIYLVNYYTVIAYNRFWFDCCVGSMGFIEPTEYHQPPSSISIHTLDGSTYLWSIWPIHPAILSCISFSGLGLCLCLLSILKKWLWRCWLGLCEMKWSLALLFLSSSCCRTLVMSRVYNKTLFESIAVECLAVE